MEWEVFFLFVLTSSASLFLLFFVFSCMCGLVDNFFYLMIAAISVAVRIASFS